MLFRSKIFSSILYITVSIANAVTISGTVIDDSTGTGIAGATMCIRMTHLAQTQPDGSFEFQIDLNAMPYAKEITIAKDGYVSGLFTCPADGEIIACGTIRLSPIVNREVNFQGIVTDSVSNLPVEGAIIVIRKRNRETENITTNESGNFSTTVQLSNGPDGIVRYDIGKPGYHYEGDTIPQSFSSTPLEIHLNPLGSLPTPTIPVSGVVLESSTSEPVFNAEVVLISPYCSTDTYVRIMPCTTYTDMYGAFSMEIGSGQVCSSVYPQYYLIVKKSGYSLYFEALSLSLSPVQGLMKKASHSAESVHMNFMEIRISRLDATDCSVPLFMIQNCKEKANREKMSFFSIDGRRVPNQYKNSKHGSSAKQMFLYVTESGIQKLTTMDH